MELGDLGSVLNTGGVIGVLGFVLAALYRGYLVPRWVHDDVREDRDRWRDTALRATDNADRALMEAEKHYNALQRRSDGSHMPDETSTTNGSRDGWPTR